MPSWEFYYENGKFFFRKWKNYEKALNFFNIALTEKPNHADCIYHKGLCLEMLGKSDEACQNISQALCINPHLQINIDNPTLLANICKLLEEYGDYKNALTFCNKAIARFPEREEFIKQKARLHNHLGLTKQDVLDVKAQRNDFNDKANGLFDEIESFKTDHGTAKSRGTKEIQKQIELLEYRQQTEVFTTDKERELIEKIKQMKSQVLEQDAEFEQNKEIHPKNTHNSDFRKHASDLHAKVTKIENKKQIESPIADDVAYVRIFEKNETEISNPSLFKEINPSKVTQKLFQDVLEKKFNITTLWHFIRPDYLESILMRGILSRNECKNQGVPIADISDAEIQSHRVKYHGYAPLFFAPCPPMIYRVMRENGERIVALAIDTRIMDNEKIIFSDGNVRVKHTKIFKSVNELDNLDWQLIRRNPEESIPFQTSDQKREHSAEVLVENLIPPTYIKSLSVHSQVMYNYVKEVLIKNKVDVPVLINLEVNGVNIMKKT